MPVASMTGGSSRTRRRRAVRLALGAIAGVSLATARPVAATALGPATTAQAPGGAVDCLGAVQEAVPGTPEWDELNAANAYCARERDQDKPAHRVPADAYREASRHDGIRFRYDTTTIGGLDAEVYRPCAAGTCPDLPTGLATFEPPYPAVVVFHGGGANSRLYRWASQPLAEAGYLVVAFDSPAGPTLEDASTVVDWLHGDDPLAAEFDGERLGIAGHSRGGVVVSEFGQRDPRVSAVVSWDRAQSTALPTDLALHTPTLFMFADYNCQQVPICEPEAYDTPPNPDGPGNKGDDFLLLHEAGVDTMQVPLRAALHLDWVPSQLSGNRYAEGVSVYYTLAWFDRYVRGATEPDVAADAFDRLTATQFDDSADRHNISQGIFDPDLADPGDPYSGNVPYRIDGLPVADRLSFYFRAKCSLTAPGSAGTVTSDDIRTDGCTAPGGGASPPRQGGLAAESDAGSSSSVTTIVAIVATVAVLLLAGGLLLTRRRSARKAEEPGDRPAGPASELPGTDP
jgi:pimeloyl-ACP methyl ester carboxylesterase